MASQQPIEKTMLVTRYFAKDSIKARLFRHRRTPRHQPGRRKELRSRAAVDQLKETKRTITYISAGAAFLPHAFQAHVGAAKAGIDIIGQTAAFLASPWPPTAPVASWSVTADRIKRPRGGAEQMPTAQETQLNDRGRPATSPAIRGERSSDADDPEG